MPWLDPVSELGFWENERAELSRAFTRAGGGRRIRAGEIGPGPAEGNEVLGVRAALEGPACALPFGTLEGGRENALVDGVQLIPFWAVT
jgi:hypothetical protein